MAGSSKDLGFNVKEPVTHTHLGLISASEHQLSAERVAKRQWLRCDVATSRATTQTGSDSAPLHKHRGHFASAQYPIRISS